MGHDFSTFIGIDTGMGRRPFTYVALDRQRRLLAMGGGSAVDVLSFTAGLQSGLAAVSPPDRPGSLKPARAEEPPLPILRLGSPRQFQLDLTGEPHGEPVTRAPAWLSACFELISHIQATGYSPFPQEDAPRQWLEAPAQSGFYAWLGLEPFEAGTLEGRLQRQLVLADLDLDVPDAMEFFEEITRFKLLRSILPYQHVMSQAELNAYMAANTAWLAVHEPSSVRQSGSLESGIVFYPHKASG